MQTPLFAKVRQVCIVVDNFEETITNFVNHLGIGPFKCWYFRDPILYRTTFRGEPAKWNMKLGITWLDDVQWEVIQPMEGASLYRRCFDSLGRGVQHILMCTGKVTFEKANRQLIEKGHPFAQTAAVNPPLKIGPFAIPRLPNKIARPFNLSFGYLDELNTLRTDIELTRYPPGFSERASLRWGKAEFCIPEGNADFESSLPNQSLQRLVKVGIVTRDLEETIRHYLDIAGVGPWHIFDISPDQLKHVSVADSSAKFSAQVAWAMIDDILFELVQPVDGDSPYQKILDERGEGVAYLGVKPIGGLEQFVSKCQSLGYACSMKNSICSDVVSAYIDTRTPLGTDLEIIETDEENLSFLFKKMKSNRVVGT